MSKIKICVVTSTRADYGLLKPLIQRLDQDSDISLSIVATGMHLCPEFGSTFTEIESDGFIIDKKIDIQISSDANSAMSKTMGMALISFSDYFQTYVPDMLIVLGDRFEIMAICCAAANQKIPIVHIHGGEVTEGAIDECYRHAITKLSILHFTSCEVYRDRVIQLGEHPSKVFNAGSLGVENTLTAKLPSIENLEKDLNFSLKKRPYGVVTYHPVTLESESGIPQVNQLIQAIDHFQDMGFIITKANADAGGREINQFLMKYAASRSNCCLVSSLGMTRYLAAIKHAAVIVGNSSSGILEGPAVKVPTVNIGTRQKGRVMADSIINCLPIEKDIKVAIAKALSMEFKKQIKSMKNPYGEGFASLEILNTIKSTPVKDMKNKLFYDLEKRYYLG